MINKDFVYSKVLPLVKEKGRTIDYFLIKSVFENQDTELVEELKNYQNSDLGYGHGLEPDSLCETSSIVSTEQAMEVISRIRDPFIKEEKIKEIVTYLESQYDKEKDGFKLVTNDVDNSPHAIWWNYSDYDKNFPYGNPDGFVIGFLFKYRKYLTSLNINKQINNMITFIRSEKFLESSMHILFNVIAFHKYVDKDIKNLIHDRIHLLVDKLLEDDKDKWNEYALEPFKIYLIDPHFTSGHNELLNKNLEILLKSVEDLNVMPKWQWYQYGDIFNEKIKYLWMGNLYYQYIKALRLHRDI